jgi:1-deoxy-D-xylulose-5-phosphate synthase
MVHTSLEAAELLQGEGIRCTVVNCRFLKPYDQDVLEEMVRSHPLVVTLEEGQVTNGFGAYMAREIHDIELATTPRVTTIGLPDAFIQHGSREGLLAELGLDAKGVAASVRRLARRGAELEPA